jgi:hypothetical protein
LIEHGVELIVPRMAHRPEVLDIGARPGPIWKIVERDRERRNAIVAHGPVQYLYPPEKGWVRVQTSVGTETISLVDLAVLVDDPGEVATMLLRLTHDDRSTRRAAMRRGGPSNRSSATSPCCSRRSILISPS